MKALFLAVLLATSGLISQTPGSPPPQDQEGASEVAAPAFPVDAKRRWRMERSDALKDLALEEVVTDEGFIFYIQKAFKQPENYAQQVVDTHLPWLIAAEKAFDEVTGFGPKAKREPVAVVVLATSGDLANYLERAPLHCYAVNTTPYNPYLATLTLVNLRAKTKNSADVRTRLLLHSAVHALWQAHSHVVDEAPGDLWLKEGLADFIAWSFGKTPTDVRLGIRLSTIIDRVIPLCKVVPFSQRWLMTVKEFVEPAPDAPEAERLDKALWSLSREDYVRAFYGRQAEVDLFFRYLYAGKKGELRPGLRRFLATSLHGEGSLTKALELESLDGLAVDFWRSLFEEYKAATPDFDVETLRGPAEVAKAAELVGATAKVAVDAASPQTGRPRPTVATGEVAATIPAPVLDMPALHSEALWLASQGQLAPAVALLETERETRGGKLNDAATRDLARLIELATVRQTYLATVAAEQGRLRIPLNGKKTSVKLLAVTKTALKLEETKRVPAEVAIESWPLDELLNQAARAKPPLGTDELRAFLGALIGDEKWQRNLKKSREANSPLETELLALPALLETGAAAHALREVINLAEAKEPDAVAIADAVRNLAKASARHPLIQKHATYLADRTRTALAETATDAHIRGLFHATKVQLSGDTLHLEYAFDSPDELLDFEFEPGGITERSVALPPAKVAEDQWMHDIGKGALRARGMVTLRHIAPLSGRVDVDLMELSYLDPVVLPTYRNSFVLIICDDLALTYMYSFGHANILSRITRGAEERLDQDNPTTYMYEVPYRIHMTSDAKALTVEAEGAETLSMAAAAPARGYTSILFNCDAMGGVTQLVIEGDLDAAARRELALRYADGELAEMGLL